MGKSYVIIGCRSEERAFRRREWCRAGPGWSQGRGAIANEKWKIKSEKFKFKMKDARTVRRVSPGRPSLFVVIINVIPKFQALQWVPHTGLSVPRIRAISTSLNWIKNDWQRVREIEMEQKCRGVRISSTETRTHLTAWQCQHKSQECSKRNH